ncbi:MAG: ribonuclease III [Clostridia bacterium]|nr:ribonuclease III [Clostridia bacterium]
MSLASAGGLCTLEAFEKKLGYRFRDPELLRLALTHPSMGAANNQRLEFLGDAVLEYIVSVRLYRDHQSEQEGSLTHRRQLLVCEEMLCGIARKMGLGDMLIMNSGYEHQGGRDNPSVLCDAVEAVLAAVCLDGGLEAAGAVVERFWPPFDSDLLPAKDAKSRLQELLQAMGKPTPVYELVGRTGPDHAPTFTVRVLLEERPLAMASGKSKQQAEQAAAAAALKLFDQAGNKKTAPDADAE